MDLLPVTAEYDDIQLKMRQFAAHRLMEIIESMKPAVAEALQDSLQDLEPGRIQAHVALLKLHTSLIKELGLLYRVQDRPREERQDTVPLVQVQQMLDAAQARMDEAVAAATEAGRELGRQEQQQREVLSLQAARQRLRGSLQALGGDRAVSP